MRCAALQSPRLFILGGVVGSSIKKLEPQIKPLTRTLAGNLAAYAVRRERSANGGRNGVFACELLYAGILLPVAGLRHTIGLGAVALHPLGKLCGDV